MTPHLCVPQALIARCRFPVRRSGEFDLNLFTMSMDRALDGRHAEGRTFVDVGSGCGRLVLAAAVLWPSLGCVAGVEQMRELHQIALKASTAVELPEPPLRRFICGDAADALADELCPDFVFAYSSAFAGFGDELTEFSAVCGTHLMPGTRVVTTDKRLRNSECWSFALLDAIEGPNRETCGSIAYVYEVITSLRV